MAETVNETLKRMGDSYALVLLARVSSVLGTGLAGVGIWIFLQVWGDLADVKKAVGPIETRITKIETVIAERSVVAVERDRRLTRIEARVFPVPQ